MSLCEADPVLEPTIEPDETPAFADPYSILACPGGKGRLRKEGDRLVADDGRDFPIENRIVRMLESIDPALAAELASQDAAREIYLDDRLVVMLYPRKVAPIEFAKGLVRKTDAAFAPSHKAFSLDEYQALVTSSGSFEVEEIHCTGLIAPIVVGILERFRALSRHIPAPNLVLEALL